MRKILKIMSVCISLLVLLMMGLTVYGNIVLPDKLYITNEEICLGKIFTADIDSEFFSVQTANTSNTAETEITATVKLANSIPVKTVAVEQKERSYVIPGGELVGIKLKTDGVLIVGTETFESDKGSVSPAEDAGIKVGDVLLSVNQTNITDNNSLTQAIADSDGSPMEMTLMRDNQQYTTTLQPQKSVETNQYKGGLWVRDCVCGIGTLTYTDISTGSFATLGHGIYDSDTREIVPSTSGVLLSANLCGITKGKSGCAGELSGSFGNTEYGNLQLNCDNGVYGYITVLASNEQAVPVAFASEVHTGDAQIITTVNGEKKYYDIKIEKTDPFSTNNKSMIIKITDEELINTTGGIIQGMSGSPIIQDGMLAGAVTHVFLNNPQKGYAIFAQTMIDTAQTILNTDELNSAA
ncbi:MAG: SpoIVB peptidase [Clostridia bacterium]|nr:SpoIVB peptidase [Clostridia bacterium]